MRNAAYIGSFTTLWMDVAEHLQTRHGWRPSLWVTGDTPNEAEAVTRFPGVGVYRHKDAIRGLWPASVRCASRRPLDAAILNRVAAFETTFYAQMERWSVEPGRITWEDARQYYLTLLRTWLRLIDSLDLGIIICPTVPHRLYDYAAYLASLVAGIPYLMVDQTGEFLKSDQGAYGLEFVTWTIEDRTRSFREAAAKAGPPSAAARRHLEDGRRDYVSAKPGYFARKEQEALQRSLEARPLIDRVPARLRLAASYGVKRLTGLGISETSRLWFVAPRVGPKDIPRLATQAVLTRHHRGVIQRAKRALDWYQRNVSPPKIDGCPYVYFAASYQPERTSVPDAGRFHAEQASVALLEAIVPKGWEIWYKEHPTNFRPPIRADNTRSVLLYEKLRAISSRLRFAAVDTDPFALIDGARAVATTTGTSGWQAMVRGIPALILGESWYSGCSEALRVRGPQDGHMAMARILAGWRPNFDGVCRYAAALETVCRDLRFRRDPTVQAERDTDPARYYARIAELAKALADGYEDWQAVVGSSHEFSKLRTGRPQ